MSDLFATLALVLFFALPAMLIVLALAHFTMTAVRTVRELRTVEHSVAVRVQP